jgi:hypothetical protein
MRSLIIILILLAQTCFGQDSPDTLRILAQQIEPGEGSKIHIAKYKVLKVLEGELNVSTIFVGYADYRGINHSTEPVLLTLLKYTGNSSIEHYYHYPNYNALKGAEKVNVFSVSQSYWEACETGKGACEPLIFYKDSKLKKTFLLLPCGGSETAVSLFKGEEILLDGTWWYNDCPPMFDLISLGDGDYFVSMYACAMGGGIRFTLKTK